MTANNHLSKNEQRALDELAKHLRAILPVTRIILYGSKVTGGFDEESDVDLLILISAEVTNEIRRQVIDQTFDINLNYDVNLSSLVVEDREWNEGMVSVLPFHDEVEEAGVEL